MRSKDAAVAIAAAIALSSSILLPSSVSPATGAQWLTNGSFDDGLSGWELSGATAEGCGSGVAGMAVNDDGALLAQTMNGPFGPGTYRLTGSSRAASGEVTMVATARDLVSTTKNQITISTLPAAYVTWTIDLALVVVQPQLRVAITLTSDFSGVACVDDLTFEGPIVAAPPPPPTDTPTSTATATAVPPTSTTVPSATTTPTFTAVPSATSTSTTAPIATLAAATATVPASTATPVPATTTNAPSFTFMNGGFEDAAAGWRKNGGEIDAVSSPKRSGNAAGRFSTDSASTSWAYQIVAIDPSRSYEFQGALLPEDGVGETYLRISWYGTSDGSGQLISSEDSPRVSSGNPGFVWLTTGARNPPAGAHSARLRVMLSAESGNATVFLDDFALSSGPLVAATASATAAPAATQTARAVEATQDARSSSAEAASTPPAPGSTAQVASTRATTAASQVALIAAAGDETDSTPRRGASSNFGGGSGAGGELRAPQKEEPAPLWPYFALPGFGLLVVAGMLYGKRRAGST